MYMETTMEQGKESQWLTRLFNDEIFFSTRKKKFNLILNMSLCVWSFYQF